MAEPWITTDDLGAYLRADIDPFNDSLAQMAIEAACDRVRTECGQVFDGVVDEVATLDGSGTDALVLPELPVVSVSSVALWQSGYDYYYDIPGSGDAAPIEVDPTAYFARLGRDGMLIRRTIGSVGFNPWNVWIEGRGLYIVTYTHGYDTPGAAAGSGVTFPALPGDLKVLATTLAARIYDQGLVAQETVGTAYQVIYSVAGSLDLTRGEQAIIAKYQAGDR